MSQTPYANNPPTTFANNDGWHDDVSDGPVDATVVYGGVEPMSHALAWQTTSRSRGWTNIDRSQNVCGSLSKPREVKNIWAQEWGNIYDVVAPPKSNAGYDLTKILEQRKNRIGTDGMWKGLREGSLQAVFPGRPGDARAQGVRALLHKLCRGGDAGDAEDQGDLPWTSNPTLGVSVYRASQRKQRMVKLSAPKGR